MSDPIGGSATHQNHHEKPILSRPLIPPSSSKTNLQLLTLSTNNKEPVVISPPKHFAVVEPGLYRSSLPSPNNFAYIRSLKLKRVIIVSPERPVRTVSKFFESHDILVSHTGLRKWFNSESWKPISEEVVKESLQLILHRENYPILVCDVGGVHLVGMIIACLRRIQNWNLNTVITEYRGFATGKIRYLNEQFIELFDIDLITIGDQPPDWFAEHLDFNRFDADEYARLVQEHRVDSSGTMLDADNSPRYRVFFYSSAGPLNTEIGSKPPRIQTL